VITPDSSHPLDEADLDKCYNVMMVQRTALIDAKREALSERTNLA